MDLTIEKRYLYGFSWHPKQQTENETTIDMGTAITIAIQLMIS